MLIVSWTRSEELANRCESPRWVGNLTSERPPNMRSIMAFLLFTGSFVVLHARSRISKIFFPLPLGALIGPFVTLAASSLSGYESKN